MKTPALQLLLRTVIILFVLMSFSPAEATEIFFSVEGSQGRQFVGETTQAGFEGKIPAVKYESELTNQQASTSGRVGQGNRRINGLVKLTKLIGAASPSFFKALRGGDVLTVTIDFISPHRSGKKVATHRVTLKNAIVVDIKQYSEPIGQVKGHMLVFEEIAFVFGEFEVTNMKSGSSSGKKPLRKLRK